MALAKSSIGPSRSCH